MQSICSRSPTRSCYPCDAAAAWRSPSSRGVGRRRTDQQPGAAPSRPEGMAKALDDRRSSRACVSEHRVGSLLDFAP